MMTREQALRFLCFCVDDALSEVQLHNYPGLPTPMYLAVWETEVGVPIVIAVWSYLKVALSKDEVEELACDLLIEKRVIQPGHKPDYII